MLRNKRSTPGFPEVTASMRKAETAGPKPPSAIREWGRPRGAQISQKYPQVKTKDRRKKKNTG
jgi:hypothetical protein